MQSAIRNPQSKLDNVTLGSQLWFDVPTMLAMLVLGVVALLFSIVNEGFPYQPLSLLGIYTSGVGLNLLDVIVRARKARGERDTSGAGVSRWFRRFGWSGTGQPVVLNFLLDVAFIAGVTLLDKSDQSLVTLGMYMLAGTRLLAHVAGRPTWIALLPVLLPLQFLLLQPYHLPNATPAQLTVVVREMVLLSLLLVMVYAILSNLNRIIREESKLAVALAEREALLQKSVDPRVLAEQVLRLDLLQDGIRAINSAIELDDLLLMVVNNAVRVLKAEQSSIGLVDERSGELIIQAATGVDASDLRRRRFPPGIGVAGWVVQHGKPLIVGDVRLDIRYVDPYTDGTVGRSTRSMLCVPLVLRGPSDAGEASQELSTQHSALGTRYSVLGTLQVTSSEPGAFDEDDQLLLSSFAEQAALAVHKSQLLDERTRQGEELRRRGEVISTLHSVGQSVLSSLELTQVYSTIITRISELSSFDHGAIYLINERTGVEDLVAATGDAGSEFRVPGSESERESGARNPELAAPDELSLREGSASLDLWRYAQTSGTAQTCSAEVCLLCVPLVNRGEPLGCILLARAGANPFNEVERDTAEKLAHAATIAIVNAGLFSRVSAQEQRTAALYRLMLKVNAAPNRRQLASVICSELLKITSSRSSALLVNDTEHASINVWAQCGEWEHADLGQVSLPMQGSNFISSILSALHEQESPGLLVIHDMPLEVRTAFESVNCITVPLAQGGRIYGLLVLEPNGNPPIPEDIRETVSLAISHSTVALERAELFEQTLTSARQSSMLYSIAANVQTSLDPAAVVQMTIHGALESLPVQSCEVYIFEAGRSRLRRMGMGVAPGVDEEVVVGHPETIPFDGNTTLAEVLHSPGLVVGDLHEVASSEYRVPSEAAEAEQELGTQHSALSTQHSVLLGRLMGSEDVLGVVRLTTTLPAEEFVRRHATFCQTLLTHSGGALERSRLYTTTLSQAKMLRQRAQQLTDILDLGSLSTANVSLPTLMPRIAAGIARSLGFAYVRIGEIRTDAAPVETWASASNWSGSTSSASSPASVPALSLEELETLMAAGRPAGSDLRGVFLDEASLARLVPGQPEANSGSSPRELALMLLHSTSGGTLGYILAALNNENGSKVASRKSQVESLRTKLAVDETSEVEDAALDPRRETSRPETFDQTERDLAEVLGIFAQRISLIIENHRIYNQLLDSTRKMEGVVLSISDGVIVTDADLNVLISNSLADRLLGAPEEGARGYPLEWLISNEELVEMLRQCVESSSSSARDIDLKLGREDRTYQAVAHPIAAPEMEVLGAVLTLRDVTAERATERAKSDFLSIVSHELRTPLNSVMGFLDIILMGKTGTLNELQTDFLGTAKQEAGVLQRLINDLLDYSQLQSRMLRLEMAPLNLSSVIARVVNQAVPRMAEEELTVTNNVPPGLLVIGDEIRLEQVFKNLLENAAKFTDAGGEIVFDCQAAPGIREEEGGMVDTEAAHPSSLIPHPSAKDVVTIAVRDNGCGIPATQIADVFERFFQAENVASRSKRGLGLGLAICKNIVESHGGQIWIESELNVGTTVHVELLVFNPDSELYEFDEKTGKAMLPPKKEETVSA